MYAVNLLIATILLVGVSARFVPQEEDYRYPRHLQFQHPRLLASARVRRQAQTSLSLNSDGSTGLGAKIPIVGNDKNVLSAIGSVGLDNKMNTASKGFGLALDNVNGHGLTVMKETIPGFGSKLTGAGHATLFQNENHNIGANAFVSKNMPNIPQVPNFNTVGGGVDYTFKNKIGASLGMAHTPFLERKDYSAMGNLNLFRNPTTSVDFSAGLKKFETPFMNSGWKPNYGLTFSRSFP
ncbi:unnamed protein product [Arctia plantaginis]|uniref:Attacin n=1 Tax=Arctia plantaginis TaxID=874455 RepID=A0A8S0YZC5_ARCPL|nr:unnamed protein product [Arctia plantaginis]